MARRPRESRTRASPTSDHRGAQPRPYLELFARDRRPNWTAWGDETADYYPSWPTYANHPQAARTAPPP